MPIISVFLLSERVRLFLQRPCRDLQVGAGEPPEDLLRPREAGVPRPARATVLGPRTRGIEFESRPPHRGTPGPSPGRDPEAPRVELQPLLRSDQSRCPTQDQLLGPRDFVSSCSWPLWSPSVVE